MNSLYIFYLKNGFLCVVYFHGDIAGAASFLPWIGKGAGIDQPDAFLGFCQRLMGVAEKSEAGFSGQCLPEQTFRVHVNVIMMSMGQEGTAVCFYR